jgi:hypothetical protein
VACEEQALAEITQQAIDAYARAHGWDPSSGEASNDWIDGVPEATPYAIRLADMLGMSRGDPL